MTAFPRDDSTASAPIYGGRTLGPSDHGIPAAPYDDVAAGHPLDDMRLRTRAKTHPPVVMSEGQLRARTDAKMMAIEARISEALARADRYGHTVAGLVAAPRLSMPPALVGCCCVCGGLLFLDPTDDARFSCWGSASREDCRIDGTLSRPWHETDGGAEKLHQLAPATAGNSAFFGFALHRLRRARGWSESDVADALALPADVDPPMPRPGDLPLGPRPSRRLALVRLLMLHAMPQRGVEFVTSAPVNLHVLERVIDAALDAVGG